MRYMVDTQAVQLLCGPAALLYVLSLALLGVLSLALFRWRCCSNAEAALMECVEAPFAGEYRTGRTFFTSRRALQSPGFLKDAIFEERQANCTESFLCCWTEY